MGILMPMPNEPALIFAAADPVTADTSGPWIKLLPSGEFSTRDGRGPFNAGLEAALAGIVSRTKAYLGGTEMMIDYDHQSFFGAVKGVGGTAKAVGWVKDFDIREDGIYGRVEWTEAAKAAIEAGEYRYISPTFATAKTTGRVTQLFNAALLNSPAMDLEAIAAAAKIPLTQGSPMDDILEALGLAEGASQADAVSAIEALQAGTSAIALAAGLKEDADSETIAASVRTALESKAPDPARFVPIDQVVALQAEVKALKDSVDGDKAEAAVLAAIEAGKLSPALKGWGLDLANKDLAKFEAFAASAPVLTGAQLGARPKPKADPDLTDTDLQVMAQMGLDTEAMTASRKDLEA